MQLDVVCSPAEIPMALGQSGTSLCGVIDVVRATTSLCVMGEREVDQVLIASDIPTARALGTSYPDYLLVGEEHAVVPFGFHIGNSPKELASYSLAGRSVIFATTNGTVAIRSCHAHGAGQIAATSLRNASAFARYALARTTITTIVLVCAGRNQGRVAVDDLYAAGIIARYVVRTSVASGSPVDVREGAAIAMTYAEARGDDALTILRASDAGQSVIHAGLETDLALCAEVACSDVVPLVQMAASSEAMDDILLPRIRCVRVTD